MNEFGNISETVLNVFLRDVDGRDVTLAQLLDEALDEEIVHSKFLLNEDGLVSFNCWTQNYVVKLNYTPEGAYLSVSERNF